MVLVKPWLEVTSNDITVHYKWRLQGGGMGWGHDIIHFLQSRNVPKQGRTFEWCAGAGFIGFSMLANGVVFIHECCLGSTAETFKPMIEQNGLRIVFDSGPVDLPGGDDPFYFLASMRAGDTPPDWLR